MHDERPGGWSRRGLMAALLALPLAPPARAVTGFLDGADLRVLIASSPGSSNDATGRLFAKVLRKHLPRTLVSVQNLPGAAGRLCEQALREAPADGLTIGFLRSNLFYRALQEGVAPGEDPADFSWVGGVSNESRLLVAGEGTEFRSLDDLMASRRPFTLPTDSMQATRYAVSLLMNALLGLRLKPVLGYESSGMALAAISGEVDGIFASHDTCLPVLEAGGRALLRIGSGRLPAALDAVPLLVPEMVQPRHHWVLPLVQAESDLGRIVAAPPGVPEDRLGPLRALLATVVADEDYIAGATALGMEVALLPGDELARRIGLLPKVDSALVARFRALLDCGLAAVDGKSAC